MIVGTTGRRRFLVAAGPQISDLLDDVCRLKGCGGSKQPQTLPKVQMPNGDNFMIRSPGRI
jgi:hypothetical protein